MHGADVDCAGVSLLRWVRGDLTASLSRVLLSGQGDSPDSARQAAALDALDYLQLLTKWPVLCVMFVMCVMCAISIQMYYFEIFLDNKDNGARSRPRSTNQ